MLYERRARHSPAARGFFRKQRSLLNPITTTDVENLPLSLSGPVTLTFIPTLAGSTSITAMSTTPSIQTSTSLSTTPPSIQTSTAATISSTFASSTTGSVQSQTGGKSTSSAVIVGSTIGVILAALLVSGMCIYLLLRRRRRTQISEKSNKITPLDPSDRRTTPLKEKKSSTPALFKLTLNPSQRHQHPINERSSDAKAQSRVTLLQNANEEMRATINRVMEYVYRLEANIESEGAREGRMKDVPDAPPPSYLS
ncbi:hypothetical protein GYMLUDRAFT_925739 [Collybiopsis luxurians FD-317 M1]|uniref:Transmembrane protein n=1 Tax=Collybiopsis luxurians FD-317 M1 TaxID=944289 RepID=A0A0D0BGF7_9AGAR|nr:hypothetical protein GYMLUDRAFT_925739 [Collybiopsis luxurians FD-317 M1]